MPRATTYMTADPCIRAAYAYRKIRSTVIWGRHDMTACYGKRTVAHYIMAGMRKKIKATYDLKELRA